MIKTSIFSAAGAGAGKPLQFPAGAGLWIFHARVVLPAGFAFTWRLDAFTTDDPTQKQLSIADSSSAHLVPNVGANNYQEWWQGFHFMSLPTDDCGRAWELLQLTVGGVGAPAWTSTVQLYIDKIRNQQPAE